MVGGFLNLRENGDPRLVGGKRGLADSGSAPEIMIDPRALEPLDNLGTPYNP